MKLAEVKASLQSPIESRTSKTNQLHRNTAIGQHLHNVLIKLFLVSYLIKFLKTKVQEINISQKRENMLFRFSIPIVLGKVQPFYSRELK